MATTLTPLQVNAVKTTTSAPAMGYVNRYDATAGPLSVTLPVLSGQNVGARTMVQKHAVDLSTNNVTFTRAGSDQFDDGTVSLVLNTSGESRTLQVVSIGGLKRWKITEAMNEGAAGGGAGSWTELTGRPVVTPEDFGAVGDGTTDDTAALTEMFNNYTVTHGGSCILIPYGKTYSTNALDIKDNTYVFGSGTLKCRTDYGGPGNPGGFIIMRSLLNNVTWIGPTVDIAGKVGVNGFDIGDVAGDFVENIHIDAAVTGTRVSAVSEDTNNFLYSGGGKGITVQFAVRNLYANIRAEDCDIGCSVEASNDGRAVENIVLDLQCKDSHRTALFLAGGRDAAAGSLDSGMYLDSIYPGVKIRLRAQGGQDASITDPVSGVVGTNYDHAGVVTLNCASAVDLDVYAAVSSRCTLIRGKATASTIKINNALMDNLQDGWDTRPITTLSAGGTYMADNVFEANVHATTHSGVLVRPHRVSTTRAVVKSRFDVSVWSQNGVGLVTQSDGTTDEFGVSVFYRFCDVRSNPGKEVVGNSAYSVLPTWTTARRFDSPVINTPTGIVKGDVGLGNVDNTSNATERAATRTLTNARVTPRVQVSNAPGATPALAWDSYDQINLTGINAAITSLTSGITGTPTAGQKGVLRFKDDGTARAITWGASWRAIGVTLPTTTTVSKTMYIGWIYNATDSKYDVLAVAQEA